MTYVSIVKKIEDRMKGKLDLLSEVVDHIGSETDSYFSILSDYDYLKNKKEKVLSKLGEITWTKCYDLEDEAGYLLGSEFEISICGKKHKHLFGQDTTLPNGNVIGWETYQQAMAMTYRV